MKPTFLVDEILSERSENTGFPSLGDAAEQSGYNVIRSKYIPFSSEIVIDPAPMSYADFNELSCVVAHGTIQFIRQVEKKYGRVWTPGMYFNKNVKSYEQFAIHYGEDMLNSDYYILPLREIQRRGLRNIFIKPLSGMKEFTGQVIKHADDLLALSKYEVLSPELLCVVAAPKQIEGEFRYVIANGKVVTGSEYRWNDTLDVRIDTHPVCDQKAAQVASSKWQPDTVYVVDIALTGLGIAKIIELNAFSSSGLYACDTYKIVRAVAEAAEKEYIGEMELESASD
jgi:hypothetical protein